MEIMALENGDSNQLSICEPFPSQKSFLNDEQNSSSSNTSECDLPDDIKIQILKELDCSSILSMGGVNHDWKRLCNDDLLWKHMCYRRSNTPDLSFWGQKLQNNPEDSEPTWRSRFQFLNQAEKNWRTGNFSSSTIAVYDHYVRGFQFHENIIIAGLFDGNVSIKNLETKKHLGTIAAHQNELRRLRFCKSTLVTSAEHCPTRVWDLNTLQPVLDLKGHSGSVTCVDVVPDQSLVITSSRDKSVKIWDTRSGNVTQTLEHENPVTSFQFFSAQENATNQANHQFNSDTLVTGTILQKSSTQNSSIFSWNLKTGSRKDKSVIWKLPVACLGSFGDRLGIGCTSGQLAMVNLRTMEVERLFKSSNGLPLVSLQFDETKMVSAAHDGAICVWSMESGKWLYKISGFTAYLCNVQFDQFKLITDGTNNRIDMRDFSNPTKISNIHSTPQVHFNITNS